jgi:hypothetical protein
MSDEMAGERLAVREDRSYQIVVGGIVLVKDGKLAAVANPAMVYGNLGYKHVQGFWHFAANNQAIIEANDAAARVFQRELITYGNAAGIAAGWLAPQDLANVKSLDQVITSLKSE